MSSLVFRRQILAGMVGFTSLAASTQAQRVMGGVPPTAAECSAAAQVLASGQRSGWEVLPRCADGGNALGSALRAARLETDSIYLFRLFGAASNVRSPAVNDASIALLADQTASAQARVVGALVGLTQFEGNFTASFRRSWNSILTEPAGTRCPVTARNIDSPYLTVSAMPTDYLSRFGTALEAAYRNSTTPSVVRDVARCVRDLIADSLPIRVTDSELNLTYICGNRFRVRNTSQEAVSVKYDVYQTSDTGELFVNAGQDVLFTTELRGTTRLFYFDRLVRTKANGNTVCPP
jgi:hypothetical protein